MLNTLRICIPLDLLPSGPLVRHKTGSVYSCFMRPWRWVSGCVLMWDQQHFRMRFDDWERRVWIIHPEAQFAKKPPKNACVCDSSATNQTQPMVLYAVVLLTINWTNPESNARPWGNTHSSSESTWESRNVYLSFSECIILCLFLFSLSVIFHMLSCVTLLMQVILMRRNRFNNRSRLILIFTKQKQENKNRTHVCEMSLCERVRLCLCVWLQHAKFLIVQYLLLWPIPSMKTWGVQFVDTM